MGKADYISDLPAGFRLAREEDISLVTLTLAQAFADYAYPIPSLPIPYSAALRFHYTVMKAMADNALRRGLILTNEDFSAVMVTVPYEDACVYPAEELADFLEKSVSREAAENMYAVFTRLGELEKSLTLPSETVYIEAFAVQTPRQGQKLGSALMRQMQSQCARRGRDLLLFTNTARNASIYTHFGFDTLLYDNDTDIHSETWVHRYSAQGK